MVKLEIKIELKEQCYQADLSCPLDISIPLREGSDTVNCFYAPPMEAFPVVSGNFIGSIARGGPVNFLNIRLNPHGNGTHTECVGHIAIEKFTINKSLEKFHFIANLVSLMPTKNAEGDRVLLKSQFEEVISEEGVDALIIRTLPNDELKLCANYSGTNPPYIDPEAMAYFAEREIKHLLTDLPSVDREKDGGALSAHRKFWRYPENPRTDCTITELIYVDNNIKDGLYLLNIQIASFEIDVSPSKPVLYKLEVL